MTFHPRHYKQICSTLGFHLKNQKTCFTLNRSSQQPLLDYTFLQSNMQKICETRDPAYNSLSLSKQTQSSLQSYIKQLQQKNSFFQKLSQSDITKQALFQKTVQNQIAAVVDKFRELKDSFNQQAQINLQSRQFDVLLPYLLSSTNTMEMELWNKILMGSLNRYHKGRLWEKDIFILILKNYLHKFESEYQVGNKKKMERDNKFKFSQNKIEDLIDVHYLIKSTSDFRIFRHKFQKQYYFNDAFRLFSNRISVINKIKFSTNINMYQLRKQCEQITPDILQKLSYLSLKNLIFFYDYYTKNGVSDKKVIETIQKQLFMRIEKQKDNISTDYMIVVIRSIFNVWKQCHFNQKFWKTQIQPFLEYYVQEFGIADGKEINPHFKSIMYYMLCCGLHNTEVFKRIYGLMDLENSKRTKTQQIMYQYMKNKSNLQLGIKSEFRIKQPAIVPTMQYNPVQRFWYNILKQIIPQQDIWKSVFISVYQIDNLVKYKNRFFALEIQGIHYRHTHDELGGDIDVEGNTGQAGFKKSGKKVVKESILESFGVKTIHINTEDKDLRVIMRLKLVNDAKIYIQGLLDKEISTENEIRVSHL